MKKSNAEILLSGLLKGYPVVKDGCTYVLSEDFYLCQEAEKGRYEKGSFLSEGKAYMKVGFGGFSLHEFIDWANSFTEKEMMENGANFGLNEVHHRMKW